MLLYLQSVLIIYCVICKVKKRTADAARLASDSLNPARPRYTCRVIRGVQPALSPVLHVFTVGLSRSSSLVHLLGPKPINDTIACSIPFRLEVMSLIACSCEHKAGHVRTSLCRNARVGVSARTFQQRFRISYVLRYSFPKPLECLLLQSLEA